MLRCDISPAAETQLFRGFGPVVLAMRLNFAAVLSDSDIGDGLVSFASRSLEGADLRRVPVGGDSALRSRMLCRCGGSGERLASHHLTAADARPHMKR